MPDLIPLSLHPFDLTIIFFNYPDSTQKFWLLGSTISKGDPSKSVSIVKFSLFEK